MADVPFQHLTQQELQELALCGITSPEQLYKTGMEALLVDLEKLKSHFPDKRFTLNRNRIEFLFGTMVTEQEYTTQTARKDDFEVKNVGPTIKFHRSRHSQRRQKTASTDVHSPLVMHNAVRTSHPWTTLLAAWSTILLSIPAVSLILLPIMMITDSLPDISLKALAICSIILPSLPYLTFSRMAQCPVCHMRLFIYKDFIRNRAAHRIPGLGYNLTAALHAIFSWRIVCPACGTPIKLLGRSSRNHQH